MYFYHRFYVSLQMVFRLGCDMMFILHTCIELIDIVKFDEFFKNHVHSDQLLYYYAVIYNIMD